MYASSCIASPLRIYVMFWGIVIYEPLVIILCMSSSSHLFHLLEHAFQLCLFPEFGCYHALHPHWESWKCFEWIVIYKPSLFLCVPSSPYHFHFLVCACKPSINSDNVFSTLSPSFLFKGAFSCIFSSNLDAISNH